VNPDQDDSDVLRFRRRRPDPAEEGVTISFDKDELLERFAEPPPPPESLHLPRDRQPRRKRGIPQKLEALANETRMLTAQIAKRPGTEQLVRELQLLEARLRELAEGWKVGRSRHQGCDP
jgi:hypothetical protein